jgi:hypothetical protein
MSRLRATSVASVIATTALVVGIVLSLVLLNPQIGVNRVPEGVAYQLVADVASSDGNSLEESRALKSVVFVGEVTDRDGEVDIGEEGYPFVLPVFAVDVETSLKGDVQGRIRLAVMQFDTPEEYGGDAVEIGERFLFAGEGPEEGLYWIDEGLGSIHIASDTEAAELIDLYTQLISQVEQTPAPEPDVDPCLLTSSPTIDIDPNKGKAGRNVRVTAKRVSGPIVHVYWRNRNNRVGKDEVRPDCETNIQLKVPRDAKPGRYDIIIVDSRGEEASERFQVVDD